MSDQAFSLGTVDWVWGQIDRWQMSESQAFSLGDTDDGWQVSQKGGSSNVKSNQTRISVAHLQCVYCAGGGGSRCRDSLAREIKSD